MYLSKFLFASLILFVFTGNLRAQKKQDTNDFHNWAPTPPMGWNSWDCYGPTVTESEVKANADYMSHYLKSSGWQYIVVDIRWYVANDKAHGYNETDPIYNIDEYGRFTPAVERFPSAAGGKGFKPLADYIHSKGLKFGFHIMRGIPTVAVKRNLPILASKATAKDVYSNKDQCNWLHDMYTVVAGRAGAQEYYNSLFKLYASWGADFIKVDDLSSPYHQDEIEMIRKAIDLTGRKIVLSTSPGETPIENAKHVQQYANMWRTVGDFWDSWQQLKEHFDVFERWNRYRIKGAYPDGDMLPLGHIGIRAERGDNRMSAFTKDEQYTLMTLWSIFRSPLMFGGDLPGNDPFTLSLITNKEVLNVLKYSSNNRQLYKEGDKVAWVADDPKTGAKYLALFYTADPVAMIEDKAIYKSGIISRNTPGKSKSIKIDLKGAKKLFLAVTDAGDGTGWDHADWISPMLYNGTDSIALSSIKWRSAKSGWGKASVNKSVSGNDLMVDGKKYPEGIGTHSNSLIEFDIPEGYSKLQTTVGLDDAASSQNVGATVNFMVFTEDPSGPVPADSAKVAVDLEQLGLNNACSVRDIWTGKQLGIFKGEFAPFIKKHGTGFYRIVPALK